VVGVTVLVGRDVGCVEESTIRTHVKRTLMKLDLRDRVQAVIFAYETGLTRPGARPHGR
jgi:hypothetical protein